jgi:hypothetical protein
MCHGEKPWQTLCEMRRRQLQLSGDWSPERDDFTWLETAFCEQFLKPLRWFGSMDHEWRDGPKAGQGGFWVLLWSRNPQGLWWDLLDQFERRSALQPAFFSHQSIATLPRVGAGPDPFSLFA